MDNTDRDIKPSICQYLNENPQGNFPEIKENMIVALRILNDTVACLVDCGIKGTPKFTIPYSVLRFGPDLVEEEPDIKFEFKLEPEIPEFEVEMQPIPDTGLVEIVTEAEILPAPKKRGRPRKVSEK